MKITVGKSKRIMASEDYATLRGMDFRKARDILTKDGFHEHEYGDKDDNNGYAVYRKGDKEVELQYRWNQGKRKGEAHAGKVTNVYVDDNINSSCGKKSVKASNEGRSDLIYVIMVNGDPIAKGSYDAMVKKSYTYNYPVQMLKFPKAKLNSLMKMAKDAHRPDPLKFAVNRFINDYTDEYDSLNASCTKKSVNAAKNIKKKSRNVQVYFWHNNAYNAVVMTDGEYWITFDDSFDGIDLYDEDVITELKSYIKTTDFNDFDDMYNQFANDENGNSPVVGDNFGGEFDTSELTKVGTIYEGKANSACGKKSIKSNKRRAIKASDFEFIMDEPEVDEEDDSLAGYYSWDELTDAQREYVVSHWGDFRSFADAMYGWFNDYIMDMYYEDKEMLADEYNEKYGFNIDTDNISWSSSSQGPYPDHWDNEKIFGKVWLATAGNLSDVDVSFGGIYDVDTYADYYVGVGDDEHIEYGVGVDELADYGADEEAISIIRNLADGAQEFVDKVWELINYTCTAYPDDEWISETLDGNPNSFTFIVDDNGDVEDIN